MSTDSRFTEDRYFPPFRCTLGLILAASVPAIGTAQGAVTEGVSFTETRAIVSINIAKKSLTVIETIDCQSALSIGEGREFLATFFSNPLSKLIGNKEAPFFGDAVPSVEVTAGMVKAVRFVPSGTSLSPGSIPDGYYQIDIAFIGSVPGAFRIVVTYRKELESLGSVDLKYRLSRRNEKINYPERPAIDWGPYELRVNCSRKYLLTLKKGVGWVETSTGKSSVDLEQGDEVIFGLSPSSIPDRLLFPQ
jgi:hypothetical protein